MIIPIGHEQAVRRFSYLTISLIGLNFLIFVFTFPVEIQQTRRIYETQEKLTELELDYAFRHLLEDPTALRSPEAYQEFREKLAEGEVIDKETEEYHNWKALYDELQARLEARVFYRFGYKPSKPSFASLITSLFLHGSISHLFFNMLFLWLVGCNMEDDWGRPVFSSLYLVGGIVACLSHHAFDPSSGIPLIGASGAISAAMGAFMIRHYKTRIRFFYFFWPLVLFLRPMVGTFRLYAAVALGLWFLQQLFYGLLTAGAAAGVAFWAHVGGFLFGMAAGVGLKFFKVEEKFLAPKIEKEIEKVELNPKLLQAFDLKDKGDLKGAIALLKEVVSEEPQNVDARLELARCCFANGDKGDAASEFEKVIEVLFAKGEVETALNTYQEVSASGIEGTLSPRAKFTIGTRLSAEGEYQASVQLFGLLTRDHPRDRLAPLALLRCSKIFLHNLRDRNLAKGALTHLLVNYPDFEGREEARRLLEAMTP